jgi:hypothetical protein
MFLEDDKEPASDSDQYNGSLHVKVMVDIKPGDQLLADYGEAFWKEGNDEDLNYDDDGEIVDKEQEELEECARLDELQKDEDQKGVWDGEEEEPEEGEEEMDIMSTSKKRKGRETTNKGTDNAGAGKIKPRARIPKKTKTSASKKK